MSHHYDELKRAALRGWNTWNNPSVLSWARLPDGLAITVGLKEHAVGTTWQPRHLRWSLVGRRGEHDEQVHPGAHAYDGSYSQLSLAWREIEIDVQTGLDGDDLVMLVTPIANQKHPASLIVESGMLWNRPGALSLQSGTSGGGGTPAGAEGHPGGEPSLAPDSFLRAELPSGTTTIHATGRRVAEPNAETTTPYLAIELSEVVGISTGRPRTVEEIRGIVEARRREHEARRERFGALAEAYNAMQSCMAWDTIYEPSGDRMITPVSRNWNRNWGGYVLFGWDTFFGAMIASVDNRELACSNAIEIVREATSAGFIPNFAGDGGFRSEDRSQPPVGSLAVHAIHRRFGETWLVEELFDQLLTWNRWWDAHRQVEPSLLAWGSDPFDSAFGAGSQQRGVNALKGAAYESGLDNSPMYDDVPFDEKRHLMLLADVGLTSMYVMDCRLLGELAEVVGRTDEARELSRRTESYGGALATLWDEESGIFLNRRTDTGEPSHRLSPTCFYPLLTDVPTPGQARRMMDEHFHNPDEFAGEWILPSIARNDPAFPEQRYWRGKVWAPMNFLVYLGLRRHGLADAAAVLAEKSRELLLREWLENGHVHENYTATTGIGCDKRDSDRFYHWGGLLGLIALIEAGHVEMEA